MVYLASLLTGLPCLASMEASIKSAQTTLELADKVLSNVLEKVSTEFAHQPANFFNSQGQATAINYPLPETSSFGTDQLNPIESVLYGFVTSTTKGSCPATSTNLFDGCLTQNYDNYLALQIQFKSRYSSGNILPLPLVGKKVLFLAYTTTSTPIKEDRVNQENSNYDGQFSANSSKIQYFLCYNPNGLGNLTSGNIGVARSADSSLGSFSDCLSRAQTN